MNNPKRGFIVPLVIAIITVLVIGGVSYVVLRNKQSQKEEVKTVSQNTSSTTASWKTYTNEKYGFEFRYPSELSLDLDFPYSKGQPLYLWLQRSDLMHQGCFPGIAFDLYQPNLPGPAKIESARDVVVGGQAAKESHEIFDQEWTCKGQEEHFETTFVRSGLKSSITLTGVAPIDQKSLDLYRDILSTFKFTGQ